MFSLWESRRGLLFLSLGMNLRVAVDLWDTVYWAHNILVRRFDTPEVLEMRKRALVRFASPSMFKVPMKEVLIVLTALN